MYDNRQHGCRRRCRHQLSWLAGWGRKIMYSLLLKLTSIAFILLSLSYRYSSLPSHPDPLFCVLLLKNNVYYII